jgi:uncharacterized protein (TIGR02598 family)
MIEPKPSAAFSLIEITVAIGVISIALLAILGLVPIGMKSGREAVDATRTSLIAQDVFNRVRASTMSNDPASQHYFGAYPTDVASFFFYTAEGARTGELLRVQYPNDKPQFYGNIKTASDFYRAKVTVGVFDQSVFRSATDPRHVTTGTTPNLLSAIVEVTWPVNQNDGSAISPTIKKAPYTFYLRKP